MPGFVPMRIVGYDVIGNVLKPACAMEIRFLTGSLLYHVCIILYTYNTVAQPRSDHDHGRGFGCNGGVVVVVAAALSAPGPV